MPQCLTPFDIRIKETGKVITVPCGKCVTCILRKGSEWSFRLMQEEKICNSAYFITLTYGNGSVPITPKRFMGLNKSDVQNFLKRLRRTTSYRAAAHSVPQKCPTASKIFTISSYASIISTKPIKYYAVGEYGGKTMRPHYHLIIFNADIELIFKSWDKGEIHVGTVTTQSCGYCMKYMLKKGQIPKHSNDDRLKEFALMSKGIGLCYINERTLSWHKASFDRLYVPISGGIKASMPRYYKLRMLSPEFREKAGQKQLERMEQERYTKRQDPDGSIWYDYSCPHTEAFRITAALQSNQRKQFLSLQNSYL